MRYLFDELDAVKNKMAARPLMLFLDYDGTLSPIAQTPQAALLPEATREVLRELSEIPSCRVTMVTGRALDNIKNLIGLERIGYVGNHGLEIEGYMLRFGSLTAPEVKDALKKLKEELEVKLSPISGILIEDKGLSISVHYRQAKEEDVPQVGNIFEAATRPYLNRREIRTDRGKMVFEIRPPVEWNKGKAVAWLLAHEKFVQNNPHDILAVGLGDDVGDEDIFMALKGTGMTILVGEPRESSAQYYLKDTDEVKTFLQKIIEWKK